MKITTTIALALLALAPATATATTPHETPLDLPPSNQTWHRAPAQTTKPIIALIHGGGWTMNSNAQTEPWAAWLQRSGYAVVNVDYRLACDQPGCPHAAKLEADVAADIIEARRRHRWLRTSSTKVIAIGFSAGGHLAAQAAMRGTADGAIGFSAPIVLRNARLSQPLAPYARSLVGCDFTACPRAWAAASPNTSQRRTPPPMYLAYGELETLVPPALHGDAMKRHGAKVVRVSGDQHSGAIFPNGWERPQIATALRYMRARGLA